MPLPESTWLELGAMDLVAERLRASGLRVSPSRTVVTALHRSQHLNKLRRSSADPYVLGGDLIVQGKASRSDETWRIELVAVNAAGAEHRTETSGSDAIKVARTAADLLLPPPCATAAGRRHARQR